MTRTEADTWFTNHVYDDLAKTPAGCRVPAQVAKNTDDSDWPLDDNVAADTRQRRQGQSPDRGPVSPRLTIQARTQTSLACTDQWLNGGGAPTPECKSHPIFASLPQDFAVASPILGNWNDLRYRTESQADLRWKSRRISSTPSGQSFVSDSLEFTNRQPRRPPATNTTQPYPASPTFRSQFESKVGLCQAKSINCVCARTLLSGSNCCYVPRGERYVPFETCPIFCVHICHRRSCALVVSRMSDVQFLLGRGYPLLFIRTP